MQIVSTDVDSSSILFDLITAIKPVYQQHHEIQQVRYNISFVIFYENEWKEVLHK